MRIYVKKLKSGNYQKNLWYVLSILLLVFQMIVCGILVSFSVNTKKEASRNSFVNLISVEYQSLSEQLRSTFYSIMYIAQSSSFTELSGYELVDSSQLYYQIIKAQEELAKYSSINVMPGDSRISAFYIRNNTKIAFNESGSMSLDYYATSIGQTEEGLNRIYHSITKNSLKNSYLHVATVDDENFLQYYLRVGDQGSNLIFLLQLPESVFSDLFKRVEENLAPVDWGLFEDSTLLLGNASGELLTNYLPTDSELFTSSELEIYHTDDSGILVSGAFKELPFHLIATFQPGTFIVTIDTIIYILLFLFSAIFMIVVSKYLATLLYRPILNMVDTLNQQLSHNQSLLQVEYLRNYMINDTAALQNMAIETPKAHHDSQYLVALISCLDSDQYSTSFTQSKRIIEEHTQQDSPEFVFIDVSFSVFALVYFKDCKEHVISSIQKCLDDLPDDIHCAFKVALSSHGGDLRSLHSQYQTCTTILDFKNNFKDALFLTLEMLPQDRFETFEYSLRDEQELLQLVSSANLEASQKFAEIIHTNFSERSLTVAEYRNLFFALFSTFHRMVYANQLELTLPSYKKIVALHSKEDFQELTLEFSNILDTALQLGNKEKLTNRINVGDKMLDYIAMNYYRDISLEDLAVELNMSSKYCSTLFKKNIGNTFKKELNTYRINIAKQQLQKNPKIKISTLALEVGFISANTFIQVFKQYVGVTPSKFVDTLSDE